MDSVALEETGIRPRQGYDAWDSGGRLKFRALYLGTVFRRRAAYFRDNATGKVYRVDSKFKTVEVLPVRRAGGECA